MSWWLNGCSKSLRLITGKTGRVNDTLRTLLCYDSRMDRVNDRWSAAFAGRKRWTFVVTIGDFDEMPRARDVQTIICHDEWRDHRDMGLTVVAVTILEDWDRQDTIPVIEPFCYLETRNAEAVT